MRNGLLVFLTVPVAIVAQTPDRSARALVEAADRSRTPARPFRSTATLTEFENGVAKSRMMLNITVKLDPQSGQYRNLIRYVQPARDTGKMLLVSGRDYWFYDPAARSSIRISPQQRLIGQASVADVLSVNLSRDYAASVARAETITDAEHKQRVCQVVAMRATSPQAAYDRIEYWLEKDSGLPIKAKFYANSGRLLKTLYYRAFRTLSGQVRPGEAVVLDGLRPSLVTTVKFGLPEFIDVPEAWFQREYLPRFSGQ